MSRLPTRKFVGRQQHLFAVPQQQHQQSQQHQQKQQQQPQPQKQFNLPLRELNSDQISGVPPMLKRHASPEIQLNVGGGAGDGCTNSNRGIFVNKAKLRRSKSASDLHRLPQKRPAIQLATVPEKIMKYSASTSNGIASTSSTATAKRNVPVTRSRPMKTVSVSVNVNSAPVSRAKPIKASVEKTSSSASASSAGSVSKPMKRIPAYDYKARFLDLQDRHKLLKEKYDSTQEQLDHVINLPELYAQSQADLADRNKELANIQEENNSLRTENDQAMAKINALDKSLNQLKNEHKTLTTSHDILSEQHSKMSVEMEGSQGTITALKTELEIMRHDLHEVRERLFRSNMERKELHNVVMDLRGNIRVFCRVRPPLPSEDDRALCAWTYLDETSLEVASNEIVSTTGGHRSKSVKHDFGFDQVFHPRSGQEDIFELVSPLIQSAMDGYNVCIFAYGQTGSGKTYTMDGIQSELGIIPRTVDLLFDSVKNYKILGWEYKIDVTFLEIYNEVLYDLLSNETKDMEIRMVSAKTPHEIYVSNITEVTVTSADHLRELMRIAKLNRATACTVGNERSSRSHAVTRLQLTGVHRKKNEVSIGTLSLVDLAGSESPKTSTRMEETKKINKSLSELTNVIMALLQKQEHIPYRNSKLTYLLMPCLGGNSKTLMFINVAPFQDCFVESIKSLRFAASVKSCKLNKAKKNRFMDTSNPPLPPQTNSFST